MEKIKFNEDQFNLSINGNTAWFSISGKAYLTPEYEDKFKKFSDFIMKSINESHAKADFSKIVTNVLYKILFHKNSEGIFEVQFVLTGVLVKEKYFVIMHGEKENWFIQQLHYSLPVDPNAINDLKYL